MIDYIQSYQIISTFVYLKSTTVKPFIFAPLLFR